MDSRMHDTHQEQQYQQQIIQQQQQQQQPMQSLASPEIVRQLALHGLAPPAAAAAASTAARPAPPVNAHPHAFLPPSAFLPGGAPAEAAAAAAAAAAPAAPTSPHRVSGRAQYDASAPHYSSASAFEWTDDLSAQLVLQRMFADCIDRIRKHNEKMEPGRKTIPDDDLLTLRSLFGHKDLVNQLRIAESGVLVCVSDSSARYFYRVESSDRAAPPYVTTPFHCTCLAFSNQVVIAHTHLYCKHQVGAQIAEALGNTRLLRLSEANLSRDLLAAQAAKQQGWSGRGKWGGGGGRGGGQQQQPQQAGGMYDEQPQHDFAS